MISERIEQIRARIGSACARVNREPASVTLVAVSKTFSAEHIKEALRAGVRDFGENYVQELLRKRKDLEQSHIRWHFVGHLQSNKVKTIIDWIDMIHSVDNRRLAEEISNRAARAGRTVDVLVEVNTTGEATKFGVRPPDVAGFVDTLSDLSHIRILGLMTIGPFLPDPEGSRPMFSRLRTLRDEIARRPQANVQMQHLSMGMTGDFEVAIEEGATIVRIGSAIFGPRTRRT